MLKFIWAVGLTIVSSILLLPLRAQAQFIDNFSDGDFTNSPMWVGDDDKFLVTDEKLTLNAPPETGTSYLATPSIAVEDGVWEVLVKMEFNPSGSNLSRIYVMSDQQNLTGALNGYFILIGGADDEISLYRQTGTTVTKIIDGTNGVLNSDAVLVKIKAVREEEGEWTLFYDLNNSGTYVMEGKVVDDIHTSSLYFGVYCKYTTTRSKQFYFDDFKVTGKPATISTVEATYKDIIITEIFADPSPVVELPAAEYIEIYNRGNVPIRLSGWTVSDGSSTGTLVGKTLDAGQYLILTTTSFAESFAIYGDVLGVKGFPSLNNSGDPISLRSSKNVLIDSVKYSDTWYKSTQKKAGGWSLELIDVNNTCGQQDNWTASIDTRGGTPGTQNSVKAEKPDLVGPRLINAMAISSDTIQLTFDENLANESLRLDDFSIEPTVYPSAVSFLPARLDKINIKVTPVLENRILYTVQAMNMRDCNHNFIVEEHSKLPFALIEKADSLDIIINEILFNPFPGGVDFVEVYNQSTKYIDLKDWRFAHWVNGVALDETKITEENKLIRPFEYKVIAADLNNVLDHYPGGKTENGIESRLPTLNDGDGSVALLDNNGKVMDGLIYTEDFHSPFLKNVEGVSLERITFGAPSQTPENWKSASATVGYATPGYLNSNTRSTITLGEEAIYIEPQVFQPLNGSPSFTQINFKFDQGGNVASVKILDAQGRVIKTVANNEILGVEGFYRWDGDTDDGQRARIGYYAVWFEVFNASGSVRTFRKRVVIAGSF